MATARLSSGTYSTPTAVPASSVVMASTRSSQVSASRLEWCAIVSAIDVTCSSIAGAYPFVTLAISSRRCGWSSSGAWATFPM